MSTGANSVETGMLTVLKAITWVIYMLASAAELFLTFMFFLQLFGANPNQAFVAFIYRWGSWFARPFQGIIAPTPLGGIAFINWNAIVAFAVYAVLAWLVSMAMGAVRRRLHKEQAALAAQSGTTPPSATAG